MGLAEETHKAVIGLVADVGEVKGILQGHGERLDRIESDIRNPLPSVAPGNGSSLRLNLQGGMLGLIIKAVALLIAAGAGAGAIKLFG